LSSILRALKKLESEPRHLEDRPFLDSKFVPLADTGPQKNATRLFITVFAGGLVCGLVILAGWWLFSDKSGPPAPSPRETALQKVPQAEVVPAVPQKTEIPERAVPAVGPAKPVAKSIAPRKALETDTGSTPATIQQPSSPAVEPVPESVAQEQATPQATPGPESNEEAPAQGEAAAVTRAPEVPPAAGEIEIPVLNDPQMRLQAITWSKDPQKRIVVINNRILRQGETVSGYRIDTINQDDVVLIDAGEKWKLLFRIK
jgi:general secretion pathway protein B